MLRTSPLAGLRLPYARSQRLLPPTPDELRQILAVAPKHIQRLVWLGYCTGARPGPSELFRLAWSDVSESAGAALMPCAAKRPGGADYRKIPLRSDLLAQLRAWRAEDEGCEWVINYHGRQVRNLGAAWRTALKRAGITRRITVYGLRHAFATETIHNGGDIRSVAVVMDHSDPSMLLKVYQHILLEKGVRAVLNSCGGNSQLARLLTRGTRSRDQKGTLSVGNPASALSRRAWRRCRGGIQVRRLRGLDY